MLYTPFGKSPSELEAALNCWRLLTGSFLLLGKPLSTRETAALVIIRADYSGLQRLEEGFEVRDAGREYSEVLDDLCG